MLQTMLFLLFLRKRQRYGILHWKKNSKKFYSPHNQKLRGKTVSCNIPPWKPKRRFCNMALTLKNKIDVFSWTSKNHVNFKLRSCMDEILYEVQHWANTSSNWIQFFYSFVSVFYKSHARIWYLMDLMVNVDRYSPYLILNQGAYS